MVRRRALIGTSGAIALMVVIQFLALRLVIPFQTAGYRAVDDPANPAYGAALFLVILVATGAMLLAFRYGLRSLIRGGIIAIAGLLTWYVLAAISPGIAAIAAAGLIIDPLPIVGSVLVIVGLVAHPEWYVIDAAGIVIGAGAAALFGISFSILPIVLLLVVLAVYDAVSVYGTKHMLTLAEGAMSMRVPVLLVIPLSREFTTASMETDDTRPADGSNGDDLGDMDAIFLGLGDLVIPSILVVSAAAIGVGEPVIHIGLLALSTPVLGAIVGSVIGLGVLITLVLQGRAHAGLPLLNGGVILGYLLGAVLDGISPLAALGL